MTLDQLISLLISMRTEENKHANVLINTVEKRGELPFVKAVLDNKYHVELTNYTITQKGN